MAALGEFFLGADLGLSLWSEMFCARLRMRKRTRITTPFQVTALAISVTSELRATVRSSVRVLQLL